jgi:replicative DNA helicase
MKDQSPHNLEIEKSLLSAILRDEDAIDEVVTLLTPDEFYHDAHRLIYSAMATMAKLGRPINAATVHEHLLSQGLSQNAGGPEYLLELHAEVLTAANLHYHAGILKDYAIRRAVIRHAGEAIRDASSGAPGSEVLTELESRLFTVGEQAHAQEVIHLRPAIQAVLDAADRLGEESAGGIPTGIPGLDDLTGGWHPGLYTIGARPGVGKSAFMLASVLAALREKIPVLCLSLEMSPEQLTQRLICMMTGINLRRFRENNRLSDDEGARIGKAAAELDAMPLYVNRRYNMRIDHIQSLTRQFIRKRGVRLVFIDYLQLIQPSDRNSNRVSELEEISRGLKLLSGDCRIPVVTLAQLNRAAAESENKKPKLSDFRGSGSIEQDSDDCYLLWRVADPAEQDVWTLGVAVEKQRNGPTGEFSVGFRRSSCRIEPLGGPRW